MNIEKLQEMVDALEDNEKMSVDSLKGELLYQVADILTPAQKKQLIKNLEERVLHFSHSSVSGHMVWYPHFLQTLKFAKEVL